MAQVRLVGPAGEQVGVVDIDQALKLAREADLDLVEVSPGSSPPVCKIMDYGKFKYEAAQKVREARKNQVNTVLKTVRFGLKIDSHDYETKAGQVLERDGRELLVRRVSEVVQHHERRRAERVGG